MIHSHQKREREKRPKIHVAMKVKSNKTLSLSKKNFKFRQRRRKRSSDSQLINKLMLNCPNTHRFDWFAILRYSYQLKINSIEMISFTEQLVLIREISSNL